MPYNTAYCNNVKIETAMHKAKIAQVEEVYTPGIEAVNADFEVSKRLVREVRESLADLISPTTITAGSAIVRESAHNSALAQKYRDRTAEVRAEMVEIRRGNDLIKDITHATNRRNL
ncbi:hypothetical protein SLS57_002934 [Botryosphaeria dothidea]